jgi:hypothetical protein
MYDFNRFNLEKLCSADATQQSHEWSTKLYMQYLDSKNNHAALKKLELQPGPYFLLE